ncbi:hypothetical protein NQ176_g6792 [Zarea fungicola]|uniref:Uncharacterized protein n=1 Tax=Zarea fungicola TaxID=93591 RepID=A0ACC1N3T8_9HYPO|nr:hypothetical protein NQ176_g6792 [Lecanicillium fungicola]
MVFFLAILLGLVPVTTLAAELPGADGRYWNVQRLKQNGSKAGYRQELYINSKDAYIIGASTFDVHCEASGFRGEWVECQNQIPYKPKEGLFVKMNPLNEITNTHEIWFSRIYVDNEDGSRTVNVTGRMEVERPQWDVNLGRQMIIVSREYV